MKRQRRIAEVTIHRDRDRSRFIPTDLAIGDPLVAERKSTMQSVHLHGCHVKRPAGAGLGMCRYGVPTGIRTPVASVKGTCPRPLDDGDRGDAAFLARDCIDLEVRPRMAGLSRGTRIPVGGANRDRTDDLYNAIVALSQLSYSPTCWRTRRILACRRGVKPKKSRLAPVQLVAASTTSAPARPDTPAIC